MPQINYSFAKRQRELKQQKKREAKQLRKEAAKHGTPSPAAPPAEPAGEGVMGK